MNEDTWNRVRKIFDEAVDLDLDARSAFLDEACAGDASLRVEVAALLASHDALGTVGGTESRHEGAPIPEAGTMLGKYKLLQQIGEGGFGTVYMAEQQEPVRRKVALKIIKLGMDTRQVIARFEAERQALALMDHPNIARVLDAGATDNGRPYFVMELVRGIPITEYCDRNKLSTRERLELFLDVCSAVQHAHQKSIIHRDLKPSNVMVTLHDGRPVPKIIDFGIAKATDRRLTEKTLFTAYEQFIGTPQYMSPEQAEMSGLDVDTRTDIYSLGVLLYELLTGTTPFDKQRLRSAGLAEIHRIIREEEPPKPSTRLSSLGESATTTAAQHRTDIAGLRRALQGDLDWIVMKALEKDRTRRFETANALRQDIRRHLASEPVSARPPSTTYRFQKFVLRNRTGVAVAGVVVAALLGGLLLAGLGLVEANRERAIARAEADTAKAINAFFNEMLASVDPLQYRRHAALATGGRTASGSAGALNREITVAEMLLHGRDGLAESFAGKPLLEATARETTGMGLLGFGLTHAAIPGLEAAWSLRREALGDDHPDTLRSQVQLAYALAEGGYAARAVPLLEEAVEASKRLYGDDDARTLGTRSFLGKALVNARRHDDADTLFTEVLEAQSRILGDDHPDTIRTRLWWAGSYMWRNQGKKAGELSEVAREAVRRTLPADDVLTAISASDHGWSLNFQGRRAEGEELLRSAVAGLTRLVGPDHPRTAGAKLGLGRSLSAPEQLDEKEQLWTEAVDALERAHGPASPVLYVAARDLAKLLIERGKDEQGFELFRRSIANFESHYGPNHSWPVDLRHGYGNALIGAGRLDEGVRELKSWIEAKAALLEDDPSDVADAELGFARQLVVLQRSADAREVAQRGLDRLRERANGDDPEPYDSLAWVLLTCEPSELRNPAEAAPIARRAVELSADAEPLKQAIFLDTLALALFRQGDHDEAIALQRQAIETVPAENADTRLALVTSLVRYLGEQGKDAESEEALRDAVDNIEGSPVDRAELLQRWANWLRDDQQDLELAERVIHIALVECGEDNDTGGRRGGLLRDLGQIRAWQGRYDEAVSHYRQALALADLHNDEGLRDSSTSWLALALQGSGDVDGALSVAQDQLDSRRARRKDCLRDEFVMGSVLLARGATDEAATLLRRVAQKARHSAGTGSGWWLGSVERNWGEALIRLDRHAEAETALLRAYAALRDGLGEKSAETRRAREALVELYESWGKTEQARAWRTPQRG
jgi:serine/threonine protein kinase/tetratricopeptide (TPR) repeat protein